MNASTRLSMNGKSSIISTALPFVLRLSKDERRVFQQNHFIGDDGKDLVGSGDDLNSNEVARCFFVN